MRRVRFGIMCRGTQFPRWQAEVIKHLLAMPGVSVGLLIVDDAGPPKRREIFKALCSRNCLWHLYEERARRRSIALQPVDLADELNGVPGMTCRGIQKGKHSQFFETNDINRIREHDLDFIPRFAFGIIRGEILSSARHGIWSYHHDDEEKYRGGPPCFWEIHENASVTGAILQRLTNELDAGVVLKKGYFRTLNSYIASRDTVLMETSRWPAQLCRHIQLGNLDSFNQSPSTTAAPIYRAPSNWQTALHFLRVGFRFARIWMKAKTTQDHWNIGVAETPIEGFLEDDKPKINWFPLSKKADFFYADPFALVDPVDVDKLHIYVETFNHKEGKGVIEYMTYEAGRFSNPVPVVNESTHLSYPFLIEIDGVHYLVPEAYASGKVNIYECKNFPLEWEKLRAVHEDLPGIDSTIIKHNNRFWMFTSDARDGCNRNQILNLYYSESLHGNWAPHQMNPVKYDVKSARCAGTPFQKDGIWYRPSMDYSEKLQWRITINRIDVLTEIDFRESPVRVIGPFEEEFFGDKTHTLSAAGKYTLVDGAKEINVFSNWSFLKQRIKGLFVCVALWFKDARGSDDGRSSSDHLHH